MRRTKLLASVLALAMTISSITVTGNDASAAAAKPKLSATKKTVAIGKTATVKVKKVSGVKSISKTTWATSKKKVAAISKSNKTSATIKGKKKGTAKITAKVTYKLKNGKKASKKLTCTVTVSNKKVAATNAPAVTATPGTAATNTPAATTAAATATPTPTVEPTATPVPTENPYYNVSGYYASYDGNKSYRGKDNLFVNYVMADSKEINTKASAVNKLSFKIDSNDSYEMGIYVNNWDCAASSLGDSAKVGTFTTNGTAGQQIDVEISGDAIAAIDNEKISFGFYTDKVDKSKQTYCLHDMYVGYTGSDVMYPVNLTYNTVGCTSTASGIYTTRQKDSSAVISDAYKSLASLTEAKGYKFGTCVTYDQIMNDKEFCNLVAKHCDSITATNEFKAYSLLNQDACQKSEDGMPAGMNYANADAIFDWAKANNLKIRGHALVWDQSMCSWFFNEGYAADEVDADGNVTNRVDAETMKKRLESYINQVMMHFEEKETDKNNRVIYCWDVVNEGLTDEADGSGGDKDHYYIRTTRDGKANPFYEVLGYEYIKIAFEAARKTIDDNNITGVDLVYNDYNVFQTYNDKRNRVINLVKYLNKDTKLVDTVGMQGYLGYGNQNNCLGDGLVSGVKDTIIALDKAGVKVQLTEMAMRNFTNTSKYMDAHSEFAKKMFSMLAEINDTTNGAFTSMSLWAFIDDPTLNYTDDTYEYDIYTPYSGLFDEVYTAKGSFNAIYEAFGGELPK